MRQSTYEGRKARGVWGQRGSKAVLAAQVQVFYACHVVIQQPAGKA